MKEKRTLLLCSALLSLVTLPLNAQGPYNFQTFDPPGAGFTVPYGINDTAQIVGYYGTTPYYDPTVARGFLLSGGTYTDLAYPGAALTFPTAINGSGQVVGFYQTTTDSSGFYGASYPFTFIGGVFTPLPEAPGSKPGTTHPRGINNSGQIVGEYIDPCFCRIHGFLFSGGGYTTLDVPGFSSTDALSINDSGVIVGNTQAVWGGGGAHGFQLSGGTYTTFDVPFSGASNTLPTGIINSGAVVGVYYDGAGIHGFLLSAGTYTSIDVPNSQPGSTVISGPALNAQGQIVGQYTTMSGEYHGFLATPAAPPPPTPSYNTCLLYDANKVVNSGSTIPIRLQLCDANGQNRSSSTIAVHAVSVVQVSTAISGEAQASGDANPDNDFRFDQTLGSTGGYIFNLKTQGMTTGTYRLNFTVTGDSYVYSAPFQVK